MELLTLVQTHKVKRIPIALMGSSFWGGLFDWIERTMRTSGMISELDRDLVHITDDVEEAVRLVCP